MSLSETKNNLNSTQTDFDKIIHRQNTNCIKYDFTAERGYPEGIKSFWVADMEKGLKSLAAAFQAIS